MLSARSLFRSPFTILYCNTPSYSTYPQYPLCCDILTSLDLLQTELFLITYASFHNPCTGSKEVFVGYYQFVDDETHALLSINTEGSLVLVETPERSTVFKCYVKNGTLYALQNDKSLRYISSTIWGPIRAVSTSFGKREECHLMSLDDDRCTGIFYPNTNWGSGGWLKQPIVDSCVLDQVTHGIADKQGMALFWPVCLGTNEDVPYQEPKKERRTKAF